MEVGREVVEHVDNVGRQVSTVGPLLRQCINLLKEKKEKRSEKHTIITSAGRQETLWGKNHLPKDIVLLLLFLHCLNTTFIKYKRGHTNT